MKTVPVISQKGKSIGEVSDKLSVFRKLDSNTDAVVAEEGLLPGLMDQTRIASDYSLCPSWGLTRSIHSASIRVETVLGVNVEVAKADLRYKRENQEGLHG